MDVRAFDKHSPLKIDWRNELLSNEIISQDRVCHILKTQLYYMADNENLDAYEPLQLKWVFPINSIQGLLSVLRNAIFLLGYGQSNNLNSAKNYNEANDFRLNLP